MSDFLGKRALVIGAGVSGLAAAGALASRFEQVVVLERDSLADDPSHRPGTPQSRQVHGLLPGGLASLCELFPGFDRDLAAAGAVPIRIPADIHEELPGFDPFPRRDLGPSGYCMSRPLLERVLRQRARAARNVVIRDSCRVLDLLLSTDGRAIAGAQFASPQGKRETVQADLVVDASARGTLTLAALLAMGLGRPGRDQGGCRHRLRDGGLRSTGAAARLASRPHLRRHSARQPLWLPDPGRGQSLDGLHHRATVPQAARRSRRVSGCRRAPADPDHSCRDQERRTGRRAAALQLSRKLMAALRDTGRLPTGADPDRRRGLPLQSCLRPGNERGGTGGEHPGPTAARACGRAARPRPGCHRTIWPRSGHGSRVPGPCRRCRIWPSRRRAANVPPISSASSASPPPCTASPPATRMSTRSWLRSATSCAPPARWTSLRSPIGWRPRWRSHRPARSTRSRRELPDPAGPT